jgi:hypothetical protein
MNNVKNDESITKLKEYLDIDDIKILNPILNEIEKTNILEIQNILLKHGIRQMYIIYKDSNFLKKQYNSYLITYYPDKIEKRLLNIYHILNGHKSGFLPIGSFIVNKYPELVNLIYSSELGKVGLDLIKLPKKIYHPELHLKNFSDWFKFKITQIYLKNPYDGIVGFYQNIELILPTHGFFGNSEIQDIIKTNKEDSIGINKSIDSLSKFYISINQKKIFASYSFSYYQGDNARDGSISIELTINDLYDIINKKAIYL